MVRALAGDSTMMSGFDTGSAMISATRRSQEHRPACFTEWLVIPGYRGRECSRIVKGRDNSVCGEPKPAPAAKEGWDSNGGVMTSDRDLVYLVAEGRQEALRTLYERNAGWLTLRLSHRCDDPGAVDEAVQDTFLAVWQQADRFDGDRGCVGAWIWGIGARKLIDVLRRRRPAATLASPPLVPAATGRSAEDEALEDVCWGDLGVALDHLSPELLAVLQATVLDGLTTTEAAELLEIPAGTVKTRLMRARRVLKEVMA